MQAHLQSCKMLLKHNAPAYKANYVMKPFRCIALGRLPTDVLIVCICELFRMKYTPLKLSFIIQTMTKRLSQLSSCGMWFDKSLKVLMHYRVCNMQAYILEFALVNRMNYAFNACRIKIIGWWKTEYLIGFSLNTNLSHKFEINLMQDKFWNTIKSSL
jgi:hypothetical protein